MFLRSMCGAEASYWQEEELVLIVTLVPLACMSALAQTLADLADAVCTLMCSARTRAGASCVGYNHKLQPQ